ncbi:UDP-2,4-diacetamido-2,4,6-trideoxy-beta-L-altropyranose hydrolase [Salinarimonas sp. NSM]|uniref:UDP-2,4-diacetamido-2,4, 6-trideoxy-beta-L-altropyranose hydrolase n=1 Tax=Salinarimonas sp. NSM TaxID=3458003 RepID=UPI0040372BC2
MSAVPRHVLMRLDATPERGLGHLMRCLALAQALQARGRAVAIASRALPEGARALAQARDVAPIDLPPLPDAMIRAVSALGPEAAWPREIQERDAAETRTAAETLGGPVETILVDHYGLDAAWEQAARIAGTRIAAIDDLLRAHACDVLIDQNAGRDGADAYADRTPPGCGRLLGPRFALLRPEFATLHDRAEIRRGPVRRILLSFGGTDAGNATGHALAALVRAGLGDRTIDVVVGALNPNRASLEAACAGLPDATLHVQTDRMAELMAAADLAVGAGGGTTWERCAVGLPSVVLALAANQEAPARAAGLEGIAYVPDAAEIAPETLAPHLQALAGSETLRTVLSARGLARVDGRGASRVAAVLCPSRVVLRPATRADGRDLHAWRNDPRVRGSSRQADEIPLERHLAWLDGVLAAPERDLLIGEEDGAPVGVLRFDRAGEEAEVSIYLVPEAMGRGVGADLLLAGCDWVRQNRPGIRRIVAEVLGGNARSAALFERCGFTERFRRYTRGLEP